MIGKTLGWMWRLYVVAMSGVYILMEGQRHSLAGGASQNDAFAVAFLVSAVWTLVMLFSSLNLWLVVPLTGIAGALGYPAIGLAIIGAAVMTAKDKGGEYGKGGSATWAERRELWRERFRKHAAGMIFLGMTLREDRFFRQAVGYHGDGHVFTVAGNGAGKGTTLIINNLLSYRGSVVVIDPKGENAEVTGRWRASLLGLGQNVRILDPFGEVGGPAGRYRANWNPLAEIDPRSPMAREQIIKIAQACIPAENAHQEEEFWITGSRQILAGVIAHVLTTEPPKRRHLARVKELLMYGGDRLWRAMYRNRALGGLARSGANYVVRGEKGGRDGLLNTVNQWTEWMASPAMAEQLTSSSFSMRDLKRGVRGTSVYVVLPPNLMDEYKPWLRLVVLSAFNRIASERKRRWRHQVLFVLDEFPTLGYMKSIEDAAGAMRGYGVRLWPIVQDLAQLQANYREKWRTFIANAGVITAFGVKDVETVTELSKMLGEHVIAEPTESVTYQKGLFFKRELNRTASKARVRAPLLAPEEVARYTAPRSGQMLVIRDGKPFRLERVAYWDRHWPWQYDRNRGVFKGGGVAGKALRWAAIVAAAMWVLRNL